MTVARTSAWIREDLVDRISKQRKEAHSYPAKGVQVAATLVALRIGYKLAKTAGQFRAQSVFECSDPEPGPFRAPSVALLLQLGGCFPRERLLLSTKRFKRTASPRYAGTEHLCLSV